MSLFWSPAVSLVLVLVLLSLTAAGAGVLYRVQTNFAGPNCVGAFTTREVKTAGVCVSAASGTGSYMRVGTLTTTAFTSSVQGYSDAACATPSGGTTSPFSESGLTNYGKCVAGTTGTTSYSVQYTARQPAFVNGVVFQGYGSSASCLARTSLSYANVTAPAACVPFGSQYVTYSCTSSALVTNKFSDAACKIPTVSSPSTTTSLSSISTSGCSTANTVMNDASVGSDRYIRAECKLASSVPSLGVQQPATSQAVSVNGFGSNLLRLYHSDKRCKSDVFFYKVLPFVLNSCSPASTYMGEATPYTVTCKASHVQFSVSKTTYSTGDAKCIQAPLAQKTIFQDSTCRADAIATRPSAYHVATVCGALPPDVAAADQLLVKEYTDATCSVESATKATLLGVCAPVLSPPLTPNAAARQQQQQQQQRPADVMYNRLITFVPSKSTAWTTPVTVKETRFLADDKTCSGTVQATNVINYQTNGPCLPDPLYPGFFYFRSARVNGLTAASAPAWFVNPISAPVQAPTKAPSSP